ncbi:MAG: adenylosuccinate lyase [Prevotellaceae bacterium]|jgi:adenylosuccinate lyase|nr:adenylosuccinate lyase [Prevotellaceae bacterium]
MMKFNTLTTITPVDGRYYAKVKELSDYFSEYALIKYRILVEIEYFIALCELPLPQLQGFDARFYNDLRDIYRNFTEDEAQKVKDIESITNHDVKAVEYYIKERMKTWQLDKYLEFVHFGLTSQDINNTAIPCSLADAVNEVYYPNIGKLTEILSKYSQEWAEITMLARTHGQPASPTKLGKEIRVFLERLDKQIAQLKTVPFSAKFGGATGNFNAHNVAYPDINWVKFGNYFVNDILTLDRSQTTTQIEHYDNLAAMFDNLKRINTILIDLCRDMWTYISMEYFKQKIKEGEVGSSAMPHKVNPIDFENAEGNLGIANAIFEHLAAKLPVSRLQRDLTDSTVLRNVGVPIAHSLLAFKSLLKGLEKLQLNAGAIQKDLDYNWAVVAEAIQTILRREGYKNPYEELKKLTRGNAGITKESITTFIEGLDVSENVKNELKTITPNNYTGYV